MTANRPRPPRELAPPTLVEDTRSLEELAKVLERTTEIAVDTEADSFYRYRERVCLVQITAGEQDYVVDPSQGASLAPLGAVFGDPRRTKVFHDGEYDVLILKRDYGFCFAGLFDTRIASAALGVASPGLASVVRARFGLELDKSLQRSDWSKRPLTRSQIAYAQQDTHYLIPLMHELRPELQARDRMAIVEGECRRLEALEAVTREFNADEFIRIQGARKLEPLAQQVLRELFVLRDELARARDVPPFKVLGNATLLTIAASRPHSLRRLEGIENLSPKIVKRLGSALVEAVERSEKRGPLREAPILPSRTGTDHLNEADLELHDRLRNWRNERASHEGIDSSLVLNRLVLVHLAEAKPRTLEALRCIEGLLEWQAQRYGREILELVAAFERDLADGRLRLTRRRRRRAPAKGSE